METDFNTLIELYKNDARSGFDQLESFIGNPELFSSLAQDAILSALSQLLKEMFCAGKTAQLIYGVLEKGTDADLERMVNLDNNLVVNLVQFIGQASRSVERKYAVRCLQRISSSVWTRVAIPAAVKKVLPEPELQQQWMQSVSLFPLDSREGEMWTEILQHTGLRFFPKPGKPWYNPSEFPCLQVLNDNFDVILQEAEALRDHQEKLVPWPEKFIIKNGWDVFGLYAFENRLDKLCDICPKTTKILESIPGLQTALFSCLRPRCHIKPHIGYYMYSEKILRVHLGLIVPDGCVLKVNGEEHTWEVGKIIVFDDTFLHEAWNPSYDTTRIVLMFDILVDVDPSLRNPEFWATAERQKSLGSDSLISNDLLGAISGVSNAPLKNVQERPKVYL